MPADRLDDAASRQPEPPAEPEAPGATTETAPKPTVVTAPAGTATTVEELPPGFWDDEPAQGPAGQRDEPLGDGSEAQPGGDERSRYVRGEGEGRKGGPVEDGRVGGEPGGDAGSHGGPPGGDTHPLFRELSAIFPGRIVAVEQLDAESARDDDANSGTPDDEPEAET